MATRKRTTTTTRRKTTAAPKRRRPATRRKAKGNGNLQNFFVPFFFIVCIVFCLGFLLFMGYRTVTASEFFDVKSVDVRGVKRVSKEEVEKTVRAKSENSGVWNADLNGIREEIEKFSFVRSATVSRVLPDGLRVNIREREPRVVVRIEGGDFWADEEAVILGLVGKDEARPPFAMHGWDREKSEKSQKDNEERVKIYLKMLADWQAYDLAKRVSTVNLADLREPHAIIEDSGEQVKIALGDENYSKRLQKGIEAIKGKGNNFEAVNLVGQNMILQPRKSE